MPLIKCHECSSDVSDSAFTCPSCGTKTNFALTREAKKSERNRLLLLIFGGIILIITVKISITAKENRDFVDSGAARSMQRMTEDFDRLAKELCSNQGRRWSYALNECREK